MGIKFDPDSKKWIAFYSKRHPLTRIPKSLRKIGLNSKMEAKRAEEMLILKIHESFHKSLVPNWKDCVAQFLIASDAQGLSNKTIENRKLCLEAYTFKDWGEKTIDSIRPNEIRELIKLKLSHRSASQQKNLLQYIRLTFAWALGEGHILHNPTPNMKFKIGAKLSSVLNEEQAKTLLKMAKELNHEWYPHWAFALYTGMRNGELYALTWDKVDLGKRQIKVDCSWNNFDGFKSTKSGDDRIVELANDLIPLIHLLKSNNDSHFVLPRIDKWDKGEQARELRMFLIGLGLPPIRFHDLRATWATIMLSKGIVPIKVMKMGGWKEIKTMQYYTRLAGVDIEGITDKLSFI